MGDIVLGEVKPIEAGDKVRYAFKHGLNPRSTVPLGTVGTVIKDVVLIGYDVDFGDFGVVCMSSKELEVLHPCPTCKDTMQILVGVDLSTPDPQGSIARLCPECCTLVLGETPLNDVLDDILVRFQRAEKDLRALARTKRTKAERDRLNGKAEGMALAFSYVHENRRGAR